MLYKFVFKTYKKIDLIMILPPQTRTYVEIYREGISGYVLVTHGETIKSNKDTHHRVLGQKYAVRNALRNRPDLDKDIRSSIWEAFFKRSKATAKLKGADNGKDN